VLLDAISQPAPEAGLEAVEAYLEQVRSVLPGDQPLLHDWMHRELDARSARAWQGLAGATLNRIAALIADGAPASELQAGRNDLARLMDRFPAEFEAHGELRAALAQLQRRIRDAEQAPASAAVPADWPAWAKSSWPLGYEPPAGLEPQEGNGKIFHWRDAIQADTAPPREFCLVVPAAQDPLGGPFLIERSLVRYEVVLAFFSRPSRALGNLVHKEPGEPFVHARPDEAAQFASAAHPSAALSLPTFAQWQMAHAVGALAPMDHAEMVWAAERDGDVVLVGRDSGPTKPLSVKWIGSRDVGFRCCYELRR
jgi:hypothetical protein